MTRQSGTKTGGRDATKRHIFGQFALSVGMPNVVAPTGWRWVALTDVARMESGHTPSKKHPEYWDGEIPWIGIRDAKAHHGETIHDTIQTTNHLGIQNSSARILPTGTVCLSRTASVGYVVTTGRPMATSQDFVNWICSDQLDARFLVYLLLFEQKSLLRFASGAIHQTIYYPELKALHICLPPLPEQRRIAAILDEVFAGVATATTNVERNLHNARQIFDAHLNFTIVGKSEGRAERKLSDLIDVTHGFAFDGKYFTEDENAYPILLTPGNFTEFGSLSFTKKNTKRFTAEFSKSFALNQGDLVIVMTDLSSKMKILGKPAFVDRGGILHNQRIGRVIFNTEGLLPKFLYYFFRSTTFVESIKDTATGTMVRHTAPKRIVSGVVGLPTLKEQARIVSQLDVLSRDVETLEELYRGKMRELDFLKQAILRKAFSGELFASRTRVTGEAAE